MRFCFCEENGFRLSEGNLFFSIVAVGKGRWDGMSVCDWSKLMVRDFLVQPKLGTPPVVFDSTTQRVYITAFKRLPGGHYIFSRPASE